MPRQWNTPDTLGELVCRPVWFPAGEVNEAILLGALFRLTQAYNWIKVGVATPEECAAAWLQAFWKCDHGQRCDMVGEVLTLAFETDDPKYLLCDGAAYAPADYPELFARISYDFGSGAGDTFRVPNVSGRTVVAVGTGAGLTPRSLADMFGTESVALNEGQLARHDHSIHGHLPGLAFAPGELPVTTPSIFPDSTGETGDGDPHPNIQPSIALYVYIRAKS